MKYKIYLNCLIALGMMVPYQYGFSQEEPKEVKYAGEFLNIGVGAKAMGMGGAFCAVADDGTAFHWNPAGLSLAKNPQFSTMYATQFGSFQEPLASYNYIGYTQPLFGDASLAVNWVRLSVDDIPNYPDLQNKGNLSFRDSVSAGFSDVNPSDFFAPDGFFDDTEDALYFSFSKLNHIEMDLGWKYSSRLPIEIPIGMNVKLIRQKLRNSQSSGIGLDIGAMFRIGLDDLFDDDLFGKLSVGLMFRDVTGTTISWNTNLQPKDPIPSSIQFGIAYIQLINKWNSSLTIAVDQDSRFAEQTLLGIDYGYSEFVSIRLGSTSEIFTVGAGLHFWRVQVDYAWNNHDLGNPHRLSGSITF